MMNLFFSKEGNQDRLRRHHQQRRLRATWASPSSPRWTTTTPTSRPSADIEGVDLVTEGVITISKVLQLRRGLSGIRRSWPPSWATQKDGASPDCPRCCLKNATDINFFVGRAINPAHQNPNLPITFGIKMQLIDEPGRMPQERWANASRSLFLLLEHRMGGIIVYADCSTPTFRSSSTRCCEEVARHAYAGRLAGLPISTSPRLIVPRHREPTMRCCIYKERAIVAERVKLAMGGDKNNPNVIEVIDIACDECPVSGYRVGRRLPRLSSRTAATAPARAARSPLTTTISAHIDPDKCVDCGKCASVCPYSAIPNHKRPCETRLQGQGHSAWTRTSRPRSTTSKCISCGACVYQCPFGAIVDKSLHPGRHPHACARATDNQEYKVYAVVAPSISSQFALCQAGPGDHRPSRSWASSAWWRRRWARTWSPRHEAQGAGREGLPHQLLLPGLCALH